MVEHTKGPWIIYDCGNGTFEVMPSMREGEICRSIGTEGDAYLIRSAPDLLECLKAAVDIIGHPTDAMSIHFRSVIAKAEGLSNG